MASGKKRRWGTVIARHDEEGNVTAYVARYVDPTDHTHRISKQFQPEYLTQAYQWLDEESYLVVLHNKGISEWTPPSMRKEQHHGTGMLFEEWVEEYFREYGKTHTLRGRTKRRTSLAKRRVLLYFTGRRLTAITENDIQRWVGRLEHDIDTPNGRETTMRMMKRLMKAACNRGLIEKNPCTYVTRKGKPTKRDVEPLTSTEVAILANAMPEYTRLAVWLSLLVGGLRAGEICGLRLRDIDLNNRVLTVRHSVDRGDEDCGPYQLCAPKTKRSSRTLPIPATLVPIIEEHIRTHCPDRNPGTMLFHAGNDVNAILPPPTLQQQFKVAKKNISRKDVTFHTLRATHATMFMVKGGTIRETMDELGHEDMDVAVGYYQRIVPEHRKEVAERIAEEYIGMMMSDEDSIEREIRNLDDEIERMREERRKLTLLLNGRQTTTDTCGPSDH